MPLRSERVRTQKKASGFGSHWDLCENHFRRVEGVDLDFQVKGW